MRGWTRIGFVISWVMTVSSWIGTIALLLGYQPRSWLGWAWIIFCMLTSSVVIFVAVAYYGMWDIGKGGTRIEEQMKDFEHSAASLILWDSYFDGLYAIANKMNIKLPETTDKTAVWVKESRKKLGV